MKGIDSIRNFIRDVARHWQIYLLLCAVVVFWQAHQGRAQSADSEASKTNRQKLDKQGNGQNDFDFEIGTWKTKLKRLMNPLTGSNTWIEYERTTIVRKVWGGRANLVELDVKGSAGQIEALSLRLYNPESHQWSLNFANVKGA